MKLNSKVVAVILIVFLFGGIGIAKGLNLWHTESSKVPIKFEDGKFAGEYNPADIRGSYTFKDIKNSFNVPVEDLAKAFGVNNIEDIASFKVKELESIYASLDSENEIGTASVRYFTALYSDLPYEMDEEVYLPKPAVSILKSLNKLNSEQDNYLTSHTVDISNIKTENNFSEHSSENTEEKKVKGKTTFKEVLDWGVPKDTLEKIIKDKLPNTNITIKDYCTEKEIEFSGIKTAVQEKVDEIKE